MAAARAATVSWVDGYHVITPHSWWTKTAINGSTISEPQRLQNGLPDPHRAQPVPLRGPPRPTSPARRQRRAPLLSPPARGSGGRRETFSIPSSRKKPSPSEGDGSQ